MAISLSKGQQVNLSKEKAGLNNIVVGLGWDMKPKKGFFSSLLSNNDIDCDASVIMLKNDKLVSGKDVIYFGNLQDDSGSVTHLGDNLTGEGDGDDEQIVIKLSSVPADYNRIVFVVNIYDAARRKQHFGLIQNAFIRLVDKKDNSEILKYNLSDEYEGMTAMIFGEVFKVNNEWQFKAVGQGTTDNDLGQLCSKYS